MDGGTSGGDVGGYTRLCPQQNITPNHCLRTALRVGRRRARPASARRGPSSGGAARLTTICSLVSRPCTCSGSTRPSRARNAAGCFLACWARYPTMPSLPPASWAAWDDRVLEQPVGRLADQGAWSFSVLLFQCPAPTTAPVSHGRLKTTILPSATRRPLASGPPVRRLLGVDRRRLYLLCHCCRLRP